MNHEPRLRCQRPVPSFVPHAALLATFALAEAQVQAAPPLTPAATSISSTPYFLKPAVALRNGLTSSQATTDGASTFVNNGTTFTAPLRYMYSRAVPDVRANPRTGIVLEVKAREWSPRINGWSDTFARPKAFQPQPHTARSGRGLIKRPMQPRLSIGRNHIDVLVTKAF